MIYKSLNQQTDSVSSLSDESGNEQGRPIMCYVCA